MSGHEHGSWLRANESNTSFGYALKSGVVELSWHDVEDVTARAASVLKQWVGEGRRVGVFARNAAEPALAYVASLRAGISPVPVNSHLTAQECAHILEDGSIDLLLVGPETMSTGLQAATLVAGVRVAGWRCPSTEGVLEWETLLANAAPDDRPDATARPYLHYTSGTTGRPKGVETPPSMFPAVQTVGELFKAYRAAVASLPAGPSLIVGPMYHTGPLNSVRHLIGGKPLIVQERFDPEQMLATIAAERVSTVTLVPTHFSRLLALDEAVRARYDISSLKAVNHTGAACPESVKRAMIDWFGLVLTEAYGATEVGSMTMIGSAEWLDRPNSVGRVQPGFEVLVLDEEGNEVPVGTTGQLFFRDLTGRGIRYHNAVDANAAAHVAPGVFTLGDIGRVDDEGYVYISDRQVDMIVSGGANIYPAEIEAALAAYPDVVDCAVIGVPNADMGEEVKALVVVREGTNLQSDTLIRYCREQLAGYKCPRSIELVKTVGRNPMGKVNKRLLRAPYWPSERTIGG